MKLESSSPVVSVPPHFKDSATLRVKDSKFEKEKNRIVLTAEIVAPESTTVDGKDYVLAGQELTFYLGLSDKVKGKAKVSPMAQLISFHEKLGLSLDLDTDALPYDGLMFDFYLCSSERIAQRFENGEYKPILDGAGEPRTLGWQWNNFLGDSILGPSSMEAQAQ
jgi:hypothetical protein